MGGASDKPQLRQIRTLTSPGCGQCSSWPTSQRGAKLKPARVRRLLSRHGIRRWSAEEIAGILAAAPLPLADQMVKGPLPAPSDSDLSLLLQRSLGYVVASNTLGRRVFEFKLTNGSVKTILAENV